ncbi:MAG TPA: flagellar biosynthesis anti-sigma factor FlgM, partial [Massilia timonae]|nr:flagellar biosynthesis anti-sigma factor FlgM [Massilia timonae]
MKITGSSNAAVASVTVGAQTVAAPV